MSDPGNSEVADAPQCGPPDSDALIAALHMAGAERFDPVHFHYLEVLAKRAAAHREGVKRLLDARLVRALAAFQDRFDLAQNEARELAARHALQYPHAAKDLQQFVDAGDFKGLRRFVAALQTGERRASLGALVRRLEQHAPEKADAPFDDNSGPRPELKTIRQFRKTLSKLSVHKQVTQALQQAPKNAGPINSHMLVLRSLALMREVSPDYLNRFMSYADTLLRLDEGEKEKLGTPKKSQGSRSAKK